MAHMWMLDDTEVAILRKYQKQHVIEPCDKAIVYRLVGLGLMALGFVEEKPLEVSESVRLTPMGKRILSRESILRNPVLRPIYRVASIVF